MAYRRVIPLRLILLVGTLVGLFAAVVSYSFTLVTGTSLWTLRNDPSSTFSYVVLMNLVYWNSWALLTPVILGLAHRYRLDRRPWWSSLLVHVGAGFVLVFAHVILAASGRYWLQSTLGMDVTWWTLVHTAYLRTLDWELTYYWAAVGLSHAMDYYGEAQDRAIRAAELETRLMEAQLEALQRQLHPHFLFNTLHAISALVYKNPEAAELVIERLGDLLRLTLTNVGAQEVPLRAELEYLDKYLEIQQVHFGDRLTVACTVAPDALDALVPNLVLQPLVENAIRHGVAPRASPGRIEIHARRAGETLELQVLDNGPGISAEELAKLNEGIGLTNTRARLDRLYAAAHRFEFAAGPEGGVHVRIVVPFRPESPARPAAVGVPA